MPIPARRLPWPSAIAAVGVMALLMLATLVTHALAAVPAGAAAQPASAEPPGSTTAPPGDWTWPLPPPHLVVQPFAPPAQPWLPGQRGVVLAGRPGERVLAAGAGVIAFAGRIGGVGVVTVSHGQLRTTYEPVAAAGRRGDRVAAGDVIGHLERNGSECAPRACLHWGLLRGSTYLDPMSLLGLVTLRLLPLGDRGG